MLLFLVLSVVSIAWAEERVEAVRELHPNGSVSIENLAGTIVVRGWNRDEVKVDARLGRGTEGLEIDSDGDSIDIEVELRSGRNIKVEGTDLEVWVPHGVELSIETVSCDVDIEGLTGVVDIESISGHIRVRGDLEELDVESVSARIEIEASSSLRDLTVETVSGSSTVEGEFHPSGDYDMETISGTLTVRIPADLCADFDVETFSGTIKNELGPRARRTSEYVPSQELSFSTCSGGASFSLSSFSGSVHILER
jgi:DUF4097 and DUF4098 domain-containing protein YvlB